jgi:ribosomal protein S18 acetylase RimI-like enzyme
MVQLAGSSNQHLINHLESKVFLSNSDLDNLELPNLIKFSIGYPTEDKVFKIIASYKNSSSKLYGAYLNEHLTAIVGVQQDEQELTVRHISVLPEFQNQRIGTLLLNHIKAQYSKCKIIAETDEESVEFYRKSGFICDPFQGNHGNLRFSCEFTK